MTKGLIAVHFFHKFITLETLPRNTTNLDNEMNLFPPFEGCTDRRHR